MTEAEEIGALLDRFYRGYGFIPKGMLQDKIQRKQVYVFRYKSRIIAVAIGRHKTVLWNLLVHPDYRGKGLGQALLKYLNPKRVRVKYTLKDPSQFYEKAGYRFVEYVVPKSFWTRTGFHKKGSELTIKIMEKASDAIQNKS